MRHVLTLALLLLVFKAHSEDQYHRDEIPKGLTPTSTTSGPYTTTKYLDAKGELVVQEGAFADGKLTYRFFMQDGKKHGVERGWDTNGTLLMERTWKNGQIDGQVREWNKDGVLLADYTMKDGAGTRRAYSPNGQLMEEKSFLNGLDEGEYRSYYENGSLHIWGTAKQMRRQGNYLIFRPDGTVSMLFIFDTVDKQHSIYIILTEDGKKVDKVQYWIGANGGASMTGFKQYAALAKKDPEMPVPHEDPEEYLPVVAAAVEKIKDKLKAPTRDELKAAK